MITLYGADVLPKGKYKDSTVEQVVKRDPKYIKWFQATMGQYCISQEVMDELYQAKTTVPRHRGSIAT